MAFLSSEDEKMKSGIDGSNRIVEVSIVVVLHYYHIAMECCRIELHSLYNSNIERHTHTQRERERGERERGMRDHRDSLDPLPSRILASR